VKLLRVLQERSFNRLGESTPRRFEGKLIAATNRDLPAEVAAGRVREDFYYRLCSDVIHVPSLKERLEADPGELEDLLLVLAERAAGPSEGPALAAEVGGWIADHLGPAHPWPGNVRELEQCVRNVMVRGQYRPLGPTTEAGLGAQVEAGALGAEELLDRYCALVYRRTGSYVEAARLLGLDRRTVKARADRAAG
jgi:DNA-binding NtrC family response regulator